MKWKFSSSLKEKEKKGKKFNDSLKSKIVKKKKNYASNFSNTTFGPRSSAKKKERKKKKEEEPSIIFTLVSDEFFSRFRRKRRLDRDRKSYRFRRGGGCGLVWLNFSILSFQCPAPRRRISDNSRKQSLQFRGSLPGPIVKKLLFVDI